MQLVESQTFYRHYGLDHKGYVCGHLSLLTARMDTSKGACYAGSEVCFKSRPRLVKGGILH